MSFEAAMPDPAASAGEPPRPSAPPAGRSREQFRAEHRATLRGVRDGVYVIPPDARNDGDGKEERRHLLAIPASDVRVGTAVYGTQSAAPANQQAPHRRIAPRWGRDPNGLVVPTYFYPTVLTYVYPKELTELRGTLRDAESDPLRREARKAFGIGAGRCGDPGVSTGSWRGIRSCGWCP